MRRASKLSLASVIVAGSLAIATPAFATIVNVGGGTWNYGSNCCKNVWSHYVHPTLYHSGTAICGSQNVKVYNTANNWANADASCGIFDSTAAYWNTY